jgi:hypothetical protein
MDLRYRYYSYSLMCRTDYMISHLLGNPQGPSLSFFFS